MLLAGFVFWYPMLAGFPWCLGRVGPTLDPSVIHAVDIPAWSSTVTLDTHRNITVPQLSQLPCSSEWTVNAR